MPTIDIEVRSVIRQGGGIVRVEIVTPGGACIERKLHMDKIETPERLAEWLLSQNLEPPVHVTELEGAFRVEFRQEVDSGTGTEYRILESVTRI